MNRIRCCTFCRNPGHTINLCQDSRIEETWRYCLREVDLRLGNSMEPEDLNDVDTLLRQLPLPFLRVLGVQLGGISVSSSPDMHITAIKNAIRLEAEHFIYLRWNERIDYLNWLDPDSYDFDDQETIQEEQEQQEEPIIEGAIIDESAIIDLNAAFIEEDPNDISHFAFFDRTPMILDDIEEYDHIFDEPQEQPIVPNQIIEPMILCLETASELSTLMECIVCMEEKTAIHFDRTNCGHSFCHLCICHHLDTSKNGPTCPNCRTMIRTLEVKDIENYEDIVKRYGNREVVVPESVSEEEEQSEFDWSAPSGLSMIM